DKAKPIPGVFLCLLSLTTKKVEARRLEATKKNFLTRTKVLCAAFFQERNIPTVAKDLAFTHKNRFICVIRYQQPFWDCLQ
ncbi:MAG: hypothetical protein K2G93_06430, partial [Rikenella sp.]|nr:hypothetical protein [Rikenella sp.]